MSVRRARSQAAPAIRADVLEAAVLMRLRDFVGDVNVWIGGRLAQREQELHRLEAAVERERQALGRLDRTRECLHEDASLRRAALRELDLLEQQRAEQLIVIKHAEAKVEEWAPEPNVEAVEKWLRELWAGILGKLERTRARRSWRWR
jgi:hypothetical protein